ncbi:MAG: DUF1801 domain-containing protein [Cyclobacteriaceae bacterium]
MQSKATTVDQYLRELPDDRRDQIKQVREVILQHLPNDYEEVMNWGMITYQVPFSICPDTYNNQPLLYAALASQKNHMAVYLSGVYCNNDSRLEFEEAYKASGKKLDMGKSCVRFRNIDNLPLDVIGQSIATYTAKEFADMYKAGRKSRGN